MKRSEQSRAGSRRPAHRHQTAAWIGIDRAFEGDDDRKLMEVQAREFPEAMAILFDWARKDYLRCERVVGAPTVLGELAAAEQHPDPRCLRGFYAVAAACFRRALPGSMQGELPFDGCDDETRLLQEWQNWLGAMFRRMIGEPELLRDVLVAQIHATSAVGRKAGARVVATVRQRLAGA